MNKQDITRIIANRTGINKEAVQLIIEEYADQVIECLSRGDNYYQRGFGSFMLVQCKAKYARNIGKGTAIRIPARVKPKFKPYRDFLNFVDANNSVNIQNQ